MHYLCLHYRHDGVVQQGEYPVDPVPVAGGVLGDDDASVVVKIKEGSLRVYDVECLNRPDRLERYWIIQARDLNDAIRIGSRILTGAGGYLEVRPILGARGDFDTMTGTH
jgi:hypothetical protein